MVVRHDYLALDWVKGEIVETLNQAQHALEAYVESPEDSSQMRFCQAYLHQVRGTLQMVEFYGAALLAEEMEQLSQALLAGDIAETQQSAAHEVLLKAMLQLPFYIEKIRASRRDLPLMLLPLLNDLRAVRGEALLSETALFKPDLAQAHQGQVPEAIAKHPRLSQLTQKIRRHYQTLLLLLLRNQAQPQHIKQLEKLFDQLITITGEAAMLPLWQASAAVVELLGEDDTASNTIKQLLGEVDKKLKLFTEQGVDFLYQTPPKELLKNLLFFIASHAEHNSARFEQLRIQFKLAEALPQMAQDGKDQLAGPDDKTIASVVDALVEELDAIKHALEIFANRGHQEVENLRPQAEQLKQAADTVAMLGLGQPRTILENQHQLLLDIIQTGGSADIEKLLDVAGALLLVESMLKSVDQKIISTGEWKDTPGQMEAARDVVIQECRAGLEEAKQGIVDYIASHWDVTHLKDVPEHLTNVRGGLEVIGLADAANVLRQCLAYIQAHLIPSQEQPQWNELDALADAITSIDYYLERLTDDEEGTGNELIHIAEKSVAMLGFPVEALSASVSSTESKLPEPVTELEAPTTEPQQEEEVALVLPEVDEPSETEITLELPEVSESEEDIAPALPEVEASDAPVEEFDDLIDDEIIEIFVEEAGEVLAALDEYFPRWAKDQHDEEALVEFRRAFHTLKGSGRMVGAHTVGELAWSIENMMNRVIDKTIEPSDQLIALVRRVHAAVPELVNAFALRQPDPFDVTPLEQAAFRFSEGATDVELPGLLEDEPTSEALDILTPLEEEPVPEPDTPPAPDALGNALPAGVDPVLVDIFRTESANNLELASQWLKALDRDLSSFILTDKLHRALHTLKGSARMAEIEAVAEVAEPAEQLVKDMIGHNEKADYEVVQLLEDVIAALEIGTGQAYPHMPRLEGTEFLLQRLADAYQNIRQQREQLDQSALTQFLSEGIGLVMDAEVQLEQWIHQPDAQESLQLLEDELVSLGKHAATAGLTEIEKLALALANVYRQVQQQKIAKNEDAVDLLEESHEALMVMIDCLAAGLTVRPADELIAQLAELSAVAAPDIEPLVKDTLEEPLPVLKPVEQAEDVTSELDVVEPPELEAEAFEQEAGVAFDDLVDPDLLAIFLEEADEIMLEISEQLHSWQNDPQNLHPVQLLQRGLHTLKGGARMADISALGNLGHELENLYEGLANGQLQANTTLFSLLHACQDRLAEMVDELRNEVMPQEAQELLAAINSYLEAPDTFEWQGKEQVPTLVPEPIEADDADGVVQDAIKASADQEILDVFLEEADELIEELDTNISEWRANPEGTEYADNIKRVLHTLKGGARLAGLNTLGDVTHDLETFLIERTHQAAVPGIDFFDNIQDQNLSIVALLERTVGAVPAPPVRAQVVQVPAEQMQAEQLHVQTDRLERLQRQQQPQEMVRVASELLEGLVNLAGETSINRGRVEQDINAFASYVDEMGNTVARLYEQLRRLDVETEAQILSNYQQGVEQGKYQEDGFDPLEMDQYSELNQITRQLSESASDLLDLKSTLVDKIRDTETLLLQQGRINTELQEKLMQTRMVPFTRLVPRLRRIVRQISTELGKQVHLEVNNAESELDRSLLERIIAPLEHMLRNAVDHGIEAATDRALTDKPKQGHIGLDIAREGGEIVLTLVDDGRGVDIEAVRNKAIERGLIDDQATLTEQEVLQFLFHSGFSTAKKVTQVSGRGVGMDVVGSEIKQMGGSVNIESKAGEGTKFTVRLPYTLAMSSALMVRLGEDTFAIPLNQIEGIVRVSPYELEEYFVADPPPFTYANQQYDFEYLGQLVQGRLKPNLEGQVMPMPVLLIRSSEYTMALLLDDLMGSREVVIKPLGPQLSTVPGLSGATILGDGNVVVVLDIHSLIRAAQVHRQSLAAEERRAQLLAAHEQAELEEQQKEAQRAPLIMVTDDSVTVRRVSTRLLERHGYEVITAKDGIDAIAVLEEHQPDLMLLDIEMPRMDGYEVAMHVRREERLREIPIIMITSRTGEKHRERAFDLGVNAYMGKPFQEGELLSSIRDLLEQDVGAP